MFIKIISSLILFTLSLQKVNFYQDADDIAKCQLQIPNGDYEVCVNATKAFSSNSYIEGVSFPYKCCYEEFKVKMYDVSMCRMVGNTEEDFKEEKKRLKDYYGAHHIKIDCSCGFIKIGFAFMTVLLALLI